MSYRTDILFITHVELPRDAGAKEVYKNLRLQVGGVDASIPVLRSLAKRAGGEAPSSGVHEPRPRFGVPPVLTPIILGEIMRRQNIRFVEISCMETGLDEIRRIVADGVGLIAVSTTWLPTPRGAVRLRTAVAQLKSMAPGTPIVVGGVGVRKGMAVRALMAARDMEGFTEKQLAEEYVLIDAQQDCDMDAIVVSESGEQTLAAMALRRRKGEPLDTLANLAIPTGSRYRFTDTQPEYTDLEHEIVDWNRYTAKLGSFDAPVRTAVGCPFQCEFCDFTKLYKPKQRSIDSLVRELRTLHDAVSPPRRVFFTDDNLALTRNRLTKFTRALLDSKLELSWRAFIRADAVDEEAAGLMGASGCRECFVGVESGDPDLLKNMNKQLDPDRALHAIHLLDRNGIGTQCTLVVGFPGECARSIERTASFLSNLPSGSQARAIHRYYAFRFQLWPLCPVARQAKRERYHLEGIGESWSHDTMNSDEAIEAMSELFLKVEGPSHSYMELLPDEWAAATTRRAIEYRDVVQKKRLQQAPDFDAAMESLVELVRDADSDLSRS